MDIERLRRSTLRVGGVCNTTTRRKVIEDAIAAIQEDGVTALAREFMGVKRYAHFGDQRTDCAYGMGPRHGSIAFRVGRDTSHRSRAPRPDLGPDDVYFLECARDFPGVERPDKHIRNRTVRDGLSTVLDALARAEGEVELLRGALTTDVEEHAVA